MFFNFSQNNSGGFYVGPENVCIRANSPEEANEKAVQSGLVYFGGVKDGRDCDCCGDRWSRVGDHDATEFPCLYSDAPYEIPDLDSEFQGKLTVKIKGWDDFFKEFKYIP